MMTFNVRVPVASDGINAWPKRRALLVRVIKTQHPDVLGTQELTEEQGTYIAAHLPGYAWFGQGREGGTKGEHMGVFYRTDRLEVLKSGDFWLSDTPSVVGSKTWGQPLPRMVTWARFRFRDHGGTFYYFNTHFPYRDQDVEARLRSADEILGRIAKLPATARVILTGDFNSAADSRVHAKLTHALQDVWLHAPKHVGPAKTFHNFTGHPDRRIDWILVRGFAPRSVRTVTTHDGPVYPSDHYPVLTVLQASGG
ncbi:endonuclease/exonuclease/phosphatase family metal-dependent hydrolase [Oleiagrimonas soli]|uniref:Endonuclease/exonuclease/phosphatase family metal-dependent hydrolase n=1 Tax=Oleiagrimonas soli TaxID=1543381 RepID=A0A841KES5_9GAMM|nr:endonuclease/exonuclease/phosphatase family metal-dependent hydrolase [Oleiagrimonas soli]